MYAYMHMYIWGLRDQGAPGGERGDGEEMEEEEEVILE